MKSERLSRNIFRMYEWIGNFIYSQHLKISRPFCRLTLRIDCCFDVREENSSCNRYNSKRKSQNEIGLINISRKKRIFPKIFKFYKNDQDISRGCASAVSVIKNFSQVNSSAFDSLAGTVRSE